MYFKIEHLMLCFIFGKRGKVFLKHKLQEMKLSKMYRSMVLNRSWVITVSSARFYQSFYQKELCVKALMVCNSCDLSQGLMDIDFSSLYSFEDLSQEHSLVPQNKVVDKEFQKVSGV